MEAATSRGGSLPVTSPSQRKEWRAVPDHCFRSNGSGVPDRGKLGQSDERTIYEEETGQLEVDFCSITIDGGGANEDVLQRRLHGISRQREDLEQMEIELRAQILARSEIMEVQKNCESTIKEHANAVVKLKEQLHEREQRVCALEMKMEEKERELRAAKIDNEAVWAKEDLLREQNKELANFRRERDGLEAERAQHIKQINDLQECIQEKEHRYLELEEQHRVAQETIMFKDEQLREAQAWMVRAQEVDAFHLTTNQTLQAEIRERTEQFNQYFLNLQKQFAEVDRHHRQAIQLLQQELAEAKEQSGAQSDDLRFRQTGSNDSSLCLQKNGNSVPGSPLDETNETKVPGVPIVPSSIIGMGAFIPPGPVIAQHPFVAQSVASSSSHISQNQLGYFQSIPASASYQHWQNQLAVAEIHQPEQMTEKDSLKSDVQLGYETLEGPRKELEPMPDGKNVKEQALDGEDPEENTNKSSTTEAVQISDMLDSNTRSKHKVNAGSSLQSDEKSTAINGLNAVSTQESNLLDERALLACLARVIPAESGCEISISSTLHNRIRRILAPLQWNDYARQHGELEEFVARHPELFVVVGDFIHLREGAKDIISASTAVAKVAAAASSYPSAALTSVAVTPVAQNHRQRKDSLAEPRSGNGQRQNGLNASGRQQGAGLSPQGKRAVVGKQPARVSWGGTIPRR